MQLTRPPRCRSTMGLMQLRHCTSCSRRYELPGNKAAFCHWFFTVADPPYQTTPQSARCTKTQANSWYRYRFELGKKQNPQTQELPTRPGSSVNLKAVSKKPGQHQTFQANQAQTWVQSQDVSLRTGRNWTFLNPTRLGS